MQYKFVGRNMEVSQKLKGVIEKKLERLSKFFSDDTVVLVTLKEEGRARRVEVTVPVKGSNIRAEVSCEDCYTGIDECLEKLERQVGRYKGRLTEKARGDKSLRADYFVPEGEKAAEKSRIVREKQVEAVPMTKEEAEAELELTGHDFYVYRDQKTEKISVIYRRREEDTYGVLEVQ